MRFMAIPLEQRIADRLTTSRLGIEEAAEPFECECCPRWRCGE